MNRRTFLAAAASGTLGLAGCGTNAPGPWEEPTPQGRPELDAIADAWGFEEVVDLEERVEGPLVDRDLADVLAAAAGDGRLLYLPPGRYRLGRTWFFPEFSSFGLVADGATIVPPKGFDGQLLTLGTPGRGSRLLVSGLEFDFRAPETGGRPIVARVDDKLAIRDVTVRGRQDVDSDMVRVDVANPDGTGRVERLHMPDGGVSRYPITACEVGSDTRGDISFVDCRIEGFPDNGLYANPPRGRVRVLGGYYANNNIASVRVNADPGSLVRGVHVRCDEARNGFQNMRGIRLRGGNDITIEDCLVEMLEVSSSDGAVTFSSQLESATLRNSRIRVDADGVNAIRIKQPPRGAILGGGGSFTVENVLVSGTAATGAAIQASHRDDCVFDGLCVYQPGRDRGAVYAQQVTGAIRNSYLAVTNAPYRFRNSNIELSDVSVERLSGSADAGSGTRCR